METNNKSLRLIGLAVIVSVVLGMWIFSPTEVVVSGVGKVSVPASSATFNVTVNSVNIGPSEALKDLQSKMSEIKTALQEINIGPNDITETQIILSPMTAISVGSQGYQAMSTISVKTSNVAMVSEIVVNMYKSGAMMVSQPVVSVENQEKLEKEALMEALKKAKTSLRETVGFRPIKKVVAIQQASSGNVASSTKVSDGNKGEFEVVKAVSVTYRVW